MPDFNCVQRSSRNSV
uniref:Uncharacterized protein n=1 Tax=Rhizophora mucronata TaxID=61149 RepID=A0A2P2NG43_RHIMU